MKLSLGYGMQSSCVKYGPMHSFIETYKLNPKPKKDNAKFPI